MRTVLITGCNGFIARNLAQRLKRQNFFLIGVSSSENSRYSYDLFFKVCLGEPLPEEIFSRPIDTVIHTAYFSGANEYQVNLLGTKLWAKQLLERGTRMQIFLSSISSLRSGSSEYGRAKYEIGQWFNSNGLTSLNLGLVIGRGGLFQRIYNIFKVSPVIPLIDGGSENIYFLGVNQLSKFIEEYCCLDADQRVDAPIMFFQPDPVRMIELYKVLSSVMHKKRIFISISSNLVYKILVFWEKYIRVKLPINKNNLKGLKQNENLAIESDFKDLGIKPLELERVIRENMVLNQLSDHTF